MKITKLILVGVGAFAAYKWIYKPYMAKKEAAKQAAAIAATQAQFEEGQGEDQTEYANVVSAENGKVRPNMWGWGRKGAERTDFGNATGKQIGDHCLYYNNQGDVFNGVWNGTTCVPRDVFFNTPKRSRSIL